MQKARDVISSKGGVQNLFLILGLLLGTLSCKKAEKRLPPVIEFEFSYGDTWNTAFSLKTATNRDTVYLRQYFIHDERLIDGGDKLEAGHTYYAVLNASEKRNFKTLFEGVKLSSLDSVYYKDMADGTAYNLNLKKAGKLKAISFYGTNPPDKLKSFVDSVLILTENLKLFPIDTTIYFRTARGIDIGQPRVNNVKFLPPELK